MKLLPITLVMLTLFSVNKCFFHRNHNIPLVNCDTRVLEDAGGVRLNGIRVGSKYCFHEPAIICKINKIREQKFEKVCEEEYGEETYCYNIATLIRFWISQPNCGWNCRYRLPDWK